MPMPSGFLRGANCTGRASSIVFDALAIGHIDRREHGVSASRVGVG
jgi:hypothetical protein